MIQENSPVDCGKGCPSEETIHVWHGPHPLHLELGSPEDKTVPSHAFILLTIEPVPVGRQDLNVK